MKQVTEGIEYKNYICRTLNSNEPKYQGFTIGKTYRAYTFEENYYLVIIDDNGNFIEVPGWKYKDVTSFATTFEEVKEDIITNINTNIVKPNELKKGEIYVVEGYYGFNHNYLFKYLVAPKENESIFISISDASTNTLYKDGKFILNVGEKCLRHATEEEKAWLEECIDKDAYIKYDDFIKTYTKITNDKAYSLLDISNVLKEFDLDDKDITNIIKRLKEAKNG